MCVVTILCGLPPTSKIGQAASSIFEDIVITKQLQKRAIRKLIENQNMFRIASLVENKPLISISEFHDLTYNEDEYKMVYEAFYECMETKKCQKLIDLIPEIDKRNIGTPQHLLLVSM
ncbi:hypothetical protein BSPWISOXPB_1880 [uncultured Gammaproteobacteria bacterium]|nr:hypothetical protein BSPWISOXPB_1880 [uncultured Gammaproteobacteria bacterium]